MNIFVELIVTLYEVFKAIVLGVFYSIVPAPQKSVDGEVILITGAGSGLGRLMCIDFAKRGAVVVGWDINAKGNEETRQMVETSGHKMHTYTCDVSNKNEIAKCAEKVVQDVGDVDILINNAGFVTGQRFLDCPDDKIIKTLEVNTLAHFWTIKCFLPSMMKRDHGHIVNIASIAGFVGGNSLADYCASKFANVGFTESLCCELKAANKEIYTTTVCPYFISTGMFEGCESRFPWILPALEPEKTARRIVRGILSNQQVLCIPRIMYLMIILKALLPVDAFLPLHKFLGATNFMDTFVGRTKRD